MSSSNMEVEEKNSNERDQNEEMQQGDAKKRKTGGFRVAVMGQGAFGQSVLEKLLENDIEVVGVSAPEPKEGKKADPLWEGAEKAGLPAIDTRSLKKEEGMSAWKELDLDLCVMAFVTVIIPDEALECPRSGTIQYHPSLLPLHRGASAIAWAIINGDKETGYSVFYPDHGVDTGPILLQESVEITPEDTVTSLYFKKLYPMGVDGMLKAVQMVMSGEAPREEQNHSLSTYEPIVRDSHAQIKWYEPAERIYNLIKGCNPKPGAWTAYGEEEGSKLRFFNCKLLEEHQDGMYGTVLNVDDSDDGYFDIKLNGGVLRVQRVMLTGQKKVNAGIFAKSVGLEVGFRFK
eukprot:TRINITY_DN3307_c0_g1_i1.p1 TRINITY_DN3307_c0_g1~~TRINITY_DN3307_c0_g1_i1.p1  ORF type:complete len:346 (-),score=126.63 TRINITY_DN3307_c0_g1_i1:15-1052(-)